MSAPRAFLNEVESFADRWLWVPSQLPESRRQVESHERVQDDPVGALDLAA